MSTYFVDSVNGNNQNDGKSANTAFSDFSLINEMTFSKGDKILLKRDSVFYDHLVVNGCGDEFSPIVVTFYGEGHKKPAILTEDCEEQAVLITGECVTVSGLEVSNRKGKKGIHILAKKHGANKNVTVKDCYVHDVWVENDLLPRPKRDANWKQVNAGITVETNKEAPTWYENLRIENNVLENVNRTGIWVGGQWFNRHKNSFPWVTNKADGMFDPWYPHKNVYVGYNLVDHAHGDGIIGIGTENLLMEHNKVFYANCMSREGQCSAGLWSMCCDGAVIQYNEVAYTGNEYGGDGEGYDIDNCSHNTIVQYNYSHHNGGGFILVCNIVCNSKESHTNNIIRNNLSVDDVVREDDAVFNFTGPMRDVAILNNTVYMTENSKRFRLFLVDDYSMLGLPQDVLFANNLLYSAHKRNWNHFKANGRFTFDSNVFFNMPPLPQKDSITETDNCYDMFPALKGNDCIPGSRLATEAFVPLWNSVLLRMGKHYPQCADKDYRGLDTKGHNYIGAFYFKDANIG